MKCFLSAGYSGTSVDDIVKASGVSKGGIYWHFKSKDEIFLHLVKKEFEQGKKDYLSMLSEGDSAIVKLNKFVDHYLIKAQSPFPALIFEFFMRVRDPVIIAKLKEVVTSEKADAAIQEILHQGINSGEFECTDVQAVAELFNSMFEGMVARFHTYHKDAYLFRRTAGIALNFLLKGIAKG
jgi:AcrR family transcriptional regulator